MDFNKHRNKSFADVSKEIQDKYEDRHDPISLRGLNHEMQQLRRKQDEVKAQQEAEQAEQQQMQQQAQGIDPALMTTNNEGIGIDSQMGGMPQQPQGGFSREASAPYNQQFAWGGHFNDKEPLLGDENNPMAQHSPRLSDGFSTLNYQPKSYNQWESHIRPKNTPSHTNYNPDMGQFTIPEFQAKGYDNWESHIRPANKPFHGSGNIPQEQAPIGSSIAQARQSTGTAQQQRQNIIPVDTLERSNPFGSTFQKGMNNATIQGGEMSLQNTTTQINESGDGSNDPTKHGRDPLMYAPALGSIAALINNKRAPKMERNFIDPSLATQAAPRQSRFDHVDMNHLERGINQQARGFSGSNLNTSGGNAGQFMANELANQGNVMNAIGQARLQAGQQNLQVDQMNAQEQARVDQMRAQQNNMLANIQGQNAGLALRYDDIDAQNEGAYRSNQNAAIQSMFQTLGSIGRENTTNNFILNALGYDEKGEYNAKGRNALEFLTNILNSRR